VRHWALGRGRRPASAYYQGRRRNRGAFEHTSSEKLARVAHCQILRPGIEFDANNVPIRLRVEQLFPRGPEGSDTAAGGELSLTTTVGEADGRRVPPGPIRPKSKRPICRPVRRSPGSRSRGLHDRKRFAIAE